MSDEEPKENPPKPQADPKKPPLPKPAPTGQEYKQTKIDGEKRDKPGEEGKKPAK